MRACCARLSWTSNRSPDRALCATGKAEFVMGVPSPIWPWGNVWGNRNARPMRSHPTQRAGGKTHGRPVLGQRGGFRRRSGRTPSGGFCARAQNAARMGGRPATWNNAQAGLPAGGRRVSVMPAHYSLGHSSSAQLCWPRGVSNAATALVGGMLICVSLLANWVRRRIVGSNLSK